MKKKIVIFGAGNIGRSFIGQVFARGGFEVVFIDADRNIVDAINKKKFYKIVIVNSKLPDITMIVEGIKAIHTDDVEAIENELSDVLYCAVCVGVNNLPKVIPVIKKEILRRIELGKEKPIDIIIAENLRNSSEYFKKELNLSSYSQTGLVETSIGKMVPTIPEEVKKKDPLIVYTEGFNNLIVDAKGFKNPVPEADDMMAIDNIKSAVDCKLFLHNLGHAALAYFGYQYDTDYIYIHQVLENPSIKKAVRKCMEQSAKALNREYPDDLLMNELQCQIDNLLNRFYNSSLKDTVYRVGADLYRKLDKEDRLIGAMLLCEKHHVPCDAIADAVAAGIMFTALDENLSRIETDDKFTRNLIAIGIERLLFKVCRLRDNNRLELKVKNKIQNAFTKIIYKENL